MKRAKRYDPVSYGKFNRPATATNNFIATFTRFGAFSDVQEKLEDPVWELMNQIRRPIYRETASISGLIKL